MKNLKNHHFSNYLYNLIMTAYYEIKQSLKEPNQDINNSNELKVESKIKNYSENKLRSINSFNKRKFKSRKHLDYHFKYKAPQFNKRNFINKDLTHDAKTDYNYSLNIFTNRTTKVKKKNKDQNEFESKMKYDPIKISNNFIKFNISKEYSKLSNKIEKINKNENKRENNNGRKIKLYKNNLKNATSEGYFGRKIRTDIPFLCDISSTFYNNYSNKSEKERHELILNEINKLKAFLINDPKNKIQIFKNFLVKFNFKNIEQLTEEQIFLICDFICINDNDILFHLIKPYFKSKDMITDLIDNLINIIKNRKDIILDAKKENSDSQEILNNNDGDLLRLRINKNNRMKIHPAIKNLIKNRKLSKTQNYFYNKMMRETYKSPYYEPFKSHRVIDNNSIKNNNIDIFNTNSLLKFLNYQKKIQLPNKHYSLDNKLLINEISKEIYELKNNYDKSIPSNRFKKSSLFRKKGISHSPSDNIQMNPEFKLNDNNNFFNRTSINFINKQKQNKNEKIPIINSNSLNNKNLDKLKNDLSNKKIVNKKNDKNLEKKLDEINERMYYKVINYQFGYNQIKNLYKLTEVAALTFANKKKFDKINLDILK